MVFNECEDQQHSPKGPLSKDGKCNQKLQFNLVRRHPSRASYSVLLSGLGPKLSSFAMLIFSLQLCEEIKYKNDTSRLRVTRYLSKELACLSGC